MVVVEIAVKHNRCSIKFRKNVGGRNDNNDGTYQTREIKYSSYLPVVFIFFPVRAGVLEGSRPE